MKKQKNIHFFKTFQLFAHSAAAAVVEATTMSQFSQEFNQEKGLSDKTCETHFSFDAKISKGNEHNKRPFCKPYMDLHTLASLINLLQRYFLLRAFSCTI